MKKSISLLALLIICSQTHAASIPPPPADHNVLVHFSSDDCPIWTRKIGQNGNAAPHCKPVTPANSKLQADAICVVSGDIIEWRSQGTQNFTINNKTGSALSNCAPASGNNYRCTVSASAGEYHYNIETSTCVLDPRILLN